MKKLEMLNKTDRIINKNILAGLLVSISIYLLNSCGSSTRSELMLESSPQAKNAETDVLSDTVSIDQPSLVNEMNLNTQTPEGKKFIKTADIKFQVNNVLRATENIEDALTHYGGYLIYSNLQNREDHYNRTNISRDSILISRQISVYNHIQLKVPNEKLDSFIRGLNSLLVFLDYRIIKMDEVTYQYLSNELKAKRLKTYEKRQIRHIDTNEAKLRDKTNAEDNLLERQNEQDDIQLNSLRMGDDIKYCSLTLEIYQKPIIHSFVISDFEYVSNLKPNIFKRIGDSVIKGWWLLEETIVFLINIWGIGFLIIALVFGLKYLRKWYKGI